MNVQPQAPAVCPIERPQQSELPDSGRERRVSAVAAVTENHASVSLACAIDCIRASLTEPSQSLMISVLYP